MKASTKRANNSEPKNKLRRNGRGGEAGGENMPPPERQASQTAPSGGSEPWANRGFPTRSFAPGSDEHRQWIADVNRYQRANDKPSRLVLDDGSQQSRVVLLADGWSCNGDGTVTAPESRRLADAA